MAKTAISKVTSKGQVTIPEEVRRWINVQAGDQIEWDVTQHGTAEIRRSGGSLEELASILPAPKRALSIDDMDRAIGRAIAEKHRARR